MGAQVLETDTHHLAATAAAALSVYWLPCLHSMASESMFLYLSFFCFLLKFLSSILLDSDEWWIRRSLHSPAHRRSNKKKNRKRKRKGKRWASTVWNERRLHARASHRWREPESTKNFPLHLIPFSKFNIFSDHGQRGQEEQLRQRKSKRKKQRKKRKIFVCKSSLAAWRGGELYEWWSWLWGLYARTCFDLNSPARWRKKYLVYPQCVQRAIKERKRRDGLLITMRTQIFFIPPSSHSIKRKKNPPFAIFSLLFIVPPSPPPPIYMNPHTLRLFSCFSQFTIQIVSDDCPKSRGNQLFCGTPPMEDFSFSLRRLPFLFLKAEEIFFFVCVSFLLNVEPNGAIGTRPSIVITAEESIAAVFPESVSSSLLFVAFLLVFYLFIMNVFPSEWQQHFSFQS